MSEPTIRVTPQQLVTLIVLDQQIAQLQIAANQLGGALSLKEEADLLISARDHIAKGKEKLQRKWAGSLQIVQPHEVERLVAP